MTATLTPGEAGAANAPAAWLPDPVHHHELRYWDGTAWTDQVADAGAVATDPLGVAPAPDSGDATTPAAVVARFRARLAGTTTHFPPDLPGEQLATALKRWASGARPDEVLLFVDTSMRHNGKTGCVITPTTFYAHELGTTTAAPHARLASAEVVGMHIEIDGTLVAGNTFGDAAPAFVEMLHELARVARGEAPVPAGAARIPVSEAMPAPQVAPPAGAPAEPEAPGRPSIGSALGQLAVAAFLGIWPVLVWMTASAEDCERDAMELVCQGGGVETTYNLGIVFLLAFFALMALARGITLLVMALRPPES